MGVRWHSSIVQHVESRYRIRQQHARDAVLRYAWQRAQYLTFIQTSVSVMPSCYSALPCSLSFSFAFGTFTAIVVRSITYTPCLIGGLWVVGPPVWFLIERFFLFRYFGDSSQYDQFNRVQELASKIWAGAVIMLTAIYTDSFPR